MHYPWVISSVPVRICSTRESYHQYPWVNRQYRWGYAVPVRDIISTRESYPQYRWGFAVPVSHILSTRKDMQYPWVNLYEWEMNEISLTGTAYPHAYCIPSRVLRIWLTGTAYPHRYWGYDARVLRIWLTGTEDMTHGYWGYDISSRVLHTLTGTVCSLYRAGTVNYPGVMITSGQALPRVHMMVCCPGATLLRVNFIAPGQVHHHLITTNVFEFL